MSIIASVVVVVVAALFQCCSSLPWAILWILSCSADSRYRTVLNRVVVEVDAAVPFFTPHSYLQYYPSFPGFIVPISLPDGHSALL